MKNLKTRIGGIIDIGTLAKMILLNTQNEAKKNESRNNKIQPSQNNGPT